MRRLVILAALLLALPLDGCSLVLHGRRPAKSHTWRAHREHVADCRQARKIGWCYDACKKKAEGCKHGIRVPMAIGRR